jgi:glycosyltransferase involved in cell wall biosynthesis
MTSRLMVIVPDRISDFVRKGEVIDRYYNPGNLFEEVHLVLANDDRPDPVALQRMAGSALLRVYNVPTGKGFFARTLAWRPWLLNGWAATVVDLARTIRPALVRCYGASLNAYAAHRIKSALAIPYVVSLHADPDEESYGTTESWRHLLAGYAQESVATVALRHADLAMPVYQSIVPYLQRLKVERYEVCYNTLNPTHLAAKQDYRLHDPVRIISAGRQFKKKNPDNIIRAVARMPKAHLTLIGDGTHHEYLREVVAGCGVADRILMRQSMSNDELCDSLPDYDLFAVHTEYRGLPKAVIEPLLTGLPVVIDRRHGQPVPELSESICVMVENTPDAYLKAFQHLIDDDILREKIGRSAYQYAQANWSPVKTEAKFVEIYGRLALRP